MTNAFDNDYQTEKINELAQAMVAKSFATYEAFDEFRSEYNLMRECKVYYIIETDEYAYTPDGVGCIWYDAAELVDNV